MSINFILFRILLLISLSIGAPTDDTEALWNDGMTFLSQNNAAKAEECGRKLHDKNPLYSDIVLGQAALIKGDYPTTYRHLRRAELNSDAAPDSVKGSIFNGLGLYEMNAQRNFNKALEYFFAGLDCAKRAKYQSLYAILLNNIVETYYLKNDPSGLEYALESLQIGKDSHNAMLIYAGTIETARMYRLKGDLDKARAFAAEALDIASRESRLNYLSEASATMGDIEAELGDWKAAIGHYEQAEKMAGDKLDVRILAIYKKAVALNATGRHNEALSSLFQALRLSDQGDIALHRPDILLAISEAYEAQGNMTNALEYHRRYSQSLDSLSKQENERFLQEARAKFDLERKDNELNLQRMDNLRRQRTLYVLAALLIIVLGAAAALLTLSHRKNKFYQLIVAQNRQDMRIESELRERIKSLEGEVKRLSADDKPDAKYGSSSLSEDKSREILARLEKAMLQDQAFKNPEMTKERLAALLQTNRSYLSKIINEHYHQSFTQYINSHRIREAVRILSDKDSEVVLKQLCADLGFSSMSTFYAQFKDAIGMTPNVYRKQALSSDPDIP